MTVRMTQATTNRRKPAGTAAEACRKGEVLGEKGTWDRKGGRTRQAGSSMAGGERARNLRCPDRLLYGNCSTGQHPLLTTAAPHLFEEGRHEEAKGRHGQADQQQQQEGEAKGVARELHRQTASRSSGRGGSRRWLVTHLK
jgi:hypothetical protein